MSAQLTIEDLLAVRQPAEADIAPDGARIAVVVADGYGERGHSPAIRLWLGPGGGGPRVSAGRPGAGFRARPGPRRPDVPLPVAGRPGRRPPARRAGRVGGGD